MRRLFAFGETVKYAIVYWSRYGNNRKIAEHLAKALEKKGQVTVMTADKADPNAMPAADVYVFSAASE